MIPEIIVFGSAIVDFICYAERLPRAGETLHGRKFATGFGGKGANQCVAANRLGAQTAMIAKLGDDSWGKNYKENLRNEGVIVDFVEQCKGETTGIAQICVADSGENNIVIVVGANNLLSTEDVTKAQEFFKNAKILICQLETPVSATITALRSFKGISILNAAPALKNAPQELIELAKILCVNESEAALMTNCDQISTLEESKVALKKFIEMGANTVIITLGELGATYIRKEEPNLYVHVPTPSVAKVVDTTGAGDAFIGSLAYYMARYPKAPLSQQIGAACSIASFSVQHPGTQTSFPDASQKCIDLTKDKFQWNKI